MKSLWFFPLNRLWFASYSSLKILQFLSSRRPLLTHVCSALQMPGAQILILTSPCNGACPFPIKLWTPSRDRENSLPLCLQHLAWYYVFNKYMMEGIIERRKGQISPEIERKDIIPSQKWNSIIKESRKEKKKKITYYSGRES